MKCLKNSLSLLLQVTAKRKLLGDQRIYLASVLDTVRRSDFCVGWRRPCDRWFSGDWFAIWTCAVWADRSDQWTATM